MIIHIMFITLFISSMRSARSASGARLRAANLPLCKGKFPPLSTHRILPA